MNISQLKKIPVEDLVTKLGGTHVKSMSGNREVYSSPFRSDSSGSFYVYTDNNKWNDFGHVGRKSGDGLDLLREYLNIQGKSDTVSDGLALGEQLFGGLTLPNIENRERVKAESNKLVVDSVRDELSPSTLNYVKGRGITDMGIIRANLKQVHFHFEKTPDRRFYAAGFYSDKGGYELRGKTKTNELKYASGEKSITKIKGEDRSKLSVFEGFFDYLTHLQREGIKTPSTDVIVLNSANLINEAVPVMQDKDYKSIDVYRHNDGPGKEVLEVIKNEMKHATVNDMIGLYRGFSDYNDMHKLTNKGGNSLRKLA